MRYQDTGPIVPCQPVSVSYVCYSHDELTSASAPALTEASSEPETPVPCSHTVTMAEFPVPAGTQRRAHTPFSMMNPQEASENELAMDRHYTDDPHTQPTWHARTPSTNVSAIMHTYKVEGEFMQAIDIPRPAQVYLDFWASKVELTHRRPLLNVDEGSTRDLPSLDTVYQIHPSQVEYIVPEAQDGSLPNVENQTDRPSLSGSRSRGERPSTKRTRHDRSDSQSPLNTRYHKRSRQTIAESSAQGAARNLDPVSTLSDHLASMSVTDDQAMHHLFDAPRQYKEQTAVEFLTQKTPWEWLNGAVTFTQFSEPDENEMITACAEPFSVSCNIIGRCENTEGESEDWMGSATVDIYPTATFSSPARAGDYGDSWPTIGPPVPSPVDH